jgi:8-oxo-dGTP diphosphatase
VDGERRVTRTTVGIILVNAAGQVLMQLRDDIPTIVDPGCWVVPGGVIDPGETPEDGARRELLEETGYRAGRLLHAYERVLDRTEAFAERQHYYVGRYDGVQTVVCYEGQELRFQDRAVLPTLKTSPDLAGIILDSLERVPPPDMP